MEGKRWAREGDAVLREYRSEAAARTALRPCGSVRPWKHRTREDSLWVRPLGSLAGGECYRLNVTTSEWDHGSMAKQKTTIYLNPDVLTATKAAALTSKRTESAVVEEALRSYLRGDRGEAVRDKLQELLDRVTQTSDLDEDAALRMAVDEVHAVRREHRAPHVPGA